MKLKHKIAQLDDVPESLRPLYSEGDDGAFYLQVEGLVPKSKLDEFRNNNVQLMQKLQTLEGIDPVKYQELIEQQRKIQEQELIEKGEVDKLVNMRVENMKADLDAQISALTKERDSAHSNLNRLLIDNEVARVATALGVAPTALDDVISRASRAFKVVDGAAVMQDSNGQIVYGKDGSTPMSLSEWGSGLRTTAPHLFIQSEGGGAKGSSTAGGAKASGSSISKISAGLAALGTD